jgi:hypothetical protein
MLAAAVFWCPLVTAPAPAHPSCGGAPLHELVLRLAGSDERRLFSQPIAEASSFRSPAFSAALVSRRSATELPRGGAPGSFDIALDGRAVAFTIWLRSGWVLWARLGPIASAALVSTGRSSRAAASERSGGEPGGAFLVLMIQQGSGRSYERLSSRPGVPDRGSPRLA